MVRIVNTTRGATLANEAILANTLWTRMRGLLGTKGLEPGTGLVLSPCNSIHTWFMGYDIDVLFLDGNGKVVQILESYAPWKMTRPYLSAREVVELPSGALKGTGTALGDTIAQEPL